MAAQTDLHTAAKRRGRDINLVILQAIRLLLELFWFLEALYISRMNLIGQQTSDNITALSSSNHKPDIVG